jgi:hypothetical protein
VLRQEDTLLTEKPTYEDEEQLILLLMILERMLQSMTRG